MHTRLALVCFCRVEGLGSLLIHTGLRHRWLELHWSMSSARGLMLGGVDLPPGAHQMWLHLPQAAAERVLPADGGTWRSFHAAAGQALPGGALGDAAPQPLHPVLQAHHAADPGKPCCSAGTRRPGWCSPCRAAAQAIGSQRDQACFEGATLVVTHQVLSGCSKLPLRPASATYLCNLPRQTALLPSLLTSAGAAS